MKTLFIKFIGGPLDGQSREIASPPVTFQVYGEGKDEGPYPDGWPATPEMIGYYEQMDGSLARYAESLGVIFMTWVPVCELPDCLKPKDAIEFAAHQEVA